MDGFVQRSKKEGNRVQKTKKKEQSDFLSEATRKFEQSNKDVGVDLLGELKDNVENVVNYFDIIKELENIKGEIQQIQFTSPCPSKEYKLIEVDNALLEAFQNGERLTFRGGVDDNVVLCTQSRTYDVKETETSNTLLLTPKMTVADVVAESSGKHLVVRKVPALRRHYLELKEMGVVSKMRLKELLRKDELRDCREEDDDMGENTTMRFSLEDLLEEVQMSEEEMHQALQGMPVIEFRGQIRWLSLELRNCVLDAVVEAIDEQCLEAQQSISFDSLRSSIADKQKIPDELLLWFLRTHCEKTVVDNECVPSSSSIDTFHPSSRLFCRTRCLPLLLSARSIQCKVFKEKIEKTLPLGMEFTFSYLEGLCLITSSVTQGNLIEYFAADDLPDQPRERLQLLLSKRDKWSVNEVTPFIEDILPRGIAPQSFMHQHCRCETSTNGNKIFCALKPL